MTPFQKYKERHVGLSSIIALVKFARLLVEHDDWNVVEVADLFFNDAAFVFDPVGCEGNKICIGEKGE